MMPMTLPVGSLIGSYAERYQSFTTNARSAKRSPRRRTLSSTSSEIRVPRARVPASSMTLVAMRTSPRKIVTVPTGFPW